jgi:hypothetical protein
VYPDKVRDLPVELRLQGILKHSPVFIPSFGQADFSRDSNYFPFCIHSFSLYVVRLVYAVYNQPKDVARATEPRLYRSLKIFLNL